MEGLVSAAVNLSLGTSRNIEEQDAIRLILHPEPQHPAQYKDNQNVDEYLACCRKISKQKFR